MGERTKAGGLDGKKRPYLRGSGLETAGRGGEVGGENYREKEMGKRVQLGRLTYFSEVYAGTEGGEKTEDYLRLDDL